MLEVENLDDIPHVLRIALVSETWPPEINGVAMTLHRLAIELQQRGHSVQVVRPGQGSNSQTIPPDVFDETLTKGLPIPTYPHLKLGLPAKRMLIKLWSLRRPDIVHIATEGPLGWSAIQAARKLSIPVSSDFRTNFHSYSQYYGLKRLRRAIALYLRKFHNQTGFTTVPTEGLRQQLQGYGFQGLQVVARGIDTQRFHPQMRSTTLRQQWGAKEDSRVYLYVGRLALEKNPLLLAQAWQIIRSKDPLAKLVLVGEGPADATFRELMPDGLYVGAKRLDDLSAHYASADVFLFPSMTETYGNVIAEAMASGLATLSFDYAASSELITHSENGWVARFGDDRQYLEWADRLCTLPSNDLRVLRAKARQTTLTHGWDAIASQFESLWRNLMSIKIHNELEKYGIDSQAKRSRELTSRA